MIIKVKSVERAGTAAVYNMTVDEYHNYIIEGGIVLKNCDALRYYCITRTLGAQKEDAPELFDELEDETAIGYDEEMTGGDMTEDYITYGGG